MKRLVIKSCKLLGNSYRTKLVGFLFVGVQYCQITKLYLCGNWQIRVTKVKNIYILPSANANLSWSWLEYFIFLNFYFVLFYPFFGGGEGWWRGALISIHCFLGESIIQTSKSQRTPTEFGPPVVSRANVVLNRWNQESAGVAAHRSARRVYFNKADLKQRELFFITTFRLAIPHW